MQSSDHMLLREQFHKDGFAIAKNLVPLERIELFKKALVSVMRLKTKSQLDNPDDLYWEIAKNDSHEAIDIIRVAREMPEYYLLSLDENILNAIKAILNSADLHMVHDLCLFRIDPKDDVLRNFAWHQDYPYNCMSLNAVTAWIPVLPVVPEMGGLQVIPGSHLEIRPVIAPKVPAAGEIFRGHKSFELAEVPSQDNGGESMQNLDNFELGDVLFLHPLTVHRSKTNKSRKARWICNPRFGDTSDPSLINRGWQTTRDKNPYIFSELHPDKLVIG